MSAPTSLTLTCVHCGFDFTYVPPQSGGRKRATCSDLCWRAHKYKQAKGYRETPFAFRTKAVAELAARIAPRPVCGSPLGSVVVPR